MSPQLPERTTRRTTLMRPWHFVVAFGVVSLLADMVYEGARSIIGPYLATLGASATLVGIVAGAGEFIGYGLRVFTGYAVGRTRRYWTWTILGYAMTVLSVPLIGVTGVLAPALVMYGTERLGKAVRSPAKDTLLSYAAAKTGRGSAFGVHQALDQTGALLGPLLLAAILTWRDGDYRLAFGILAIPGVLLLCMLLWLRSRVPDPREYESSLEDTTAPDTAPIAHATGLPATFWQYVAVVAVLSAGVASFPLIAFLVGRLYDAYGPRVLVAVPVAAAIAAIAFTSSVALLWIGVAIWGVVNGVLDSTVKAVVSEIVPSTSRAAGFGWLALVRGLGLLVAGAALGLAYEHNPATAIGLIVAINVVALAGLVAILRRIERRGTQRSEG
jgi:MFS family permease